MRFIVSLCFLCLALCPIASAQQTPSLNLPLGQEVTLTIGSGGTTVVSRAAASDASPALEQTSRDVNAGVYGPSAGSNYAQAPLTRDDTGGAIEPNTFRIKLITLGGHQTVLMIRNGYGQALSYRAVLHRGLQSTPTDVCMVRPQGFGVEQWPYEIDSVDLSEFTLVPFNDGDQLVCR